MGRSERRWLELARLVAAVAELGVEERYGTALIARLQKQARPFRLPTHPATMYQQFCFLEGASELVPKSAHRIFQP